MSEAVTLSSVGMQAVLTGLKNYGEEFKTAAKRAVSDAHRWAKAQGMSEIAMVTGIKISVVRKRTVARLVFKDGAGRVWFGLNPVSAKYTGQVPGGAFKSDTLSGHYFQRLGKARLPIEKVETPMEPEASTAVAHVAAQIEEKFFEFLERRLK